jgi:hypothetical protein
MHFFIPVHYYGKTERKFLTFKEPRNQFQGVDSASLCSLAGRYDNPIPTRFLNPIDCPKIAAQITFTDWAGHKKVLLPGALAFPAVSVCSDLTLLGGRRGGGLDSLGKLRDLFTFPTGTPSCSAGASASGTGASGTDRPGCVLKKRAVLQIRDPVPIFDPWIQDLVPF